MQTLQIIATVMSIVSYSAVTFLAAFAFVRLKRQADDIMDLKMVAAKTLALVTGEHIRTMFESINDMKETFLRLVDEERFEEAEDLKQAIGKSEQQAFRELDRFRERFGEDCVHIQNTNIRRDRP